MTRLVHTFLALDPFDKTGEKTWPIGLVQDQLDAILKSNHRGRLARLKLVVEVTNDPIVVFEDWKRPEHEDGLCYCGLPKFDYRAPDVTVPAPPNMVFCVFVKPSGKICRWNWEPADQDYPDFPEGWDKDRFGRQLWPEEKKI